MVIGYLRRSADGFGIDEFRFDYLTVVLSYTLERKESVWVVPGTTWVGEG
jgi:hypothetical protein